MKNYLNFETEIKDLETKLDSLKDPYNNEGISNNFVANYQQDDSEIMFLRYYVFKHNVLPKELPI